MNTPNNFQHFIGKQVSLTKETKYSKFAQMDLTDYHYSDDDPVIKELKIQAINDNLKIRIMPPNTCGTCDYCTDRINVGIDENGFVVSIGIG